MLQPIFIDLIAAAEQPEHITNVPGSRTELATDPNVVLQRTLDHQKMWDDGRYAPANELIDVTKLLELDRERIHYQWAAWQARDGARRDELMHVVESSTPPPHILNYPRTISDLTSRLGQIQAPTLVIWGTHDLTLKPASFPPLVSAIPGAAGHPIRGSGHQPHIGQPDLVNQLILGFLAEIDVDEHHHRLWLRLCPTPSRPNSRTGILRIALLRFA